VAQSEHGNSEVTIQTFTKENQVKQQNSSHKLQLAAPCGYWWAVLFFT
jgi:hypothetical protein